MVADRQAWAPRRDAGGRQPPVQCPDEGMRDPVSGSDPCGEQGSTVFGLLAGTFGTLSVGTFGTDSADDAALPYRSCLYRTLQGMVEALTHWRAGGAAMATTADSGRRHERHRPPWRRPRTTEPDSALSFILVVLLAVGAAWLLLSSQMLEITVPRSLIPKTRPAAPNRSTQGTTPVTTMSTAAMTEEPTESPAAMPPSPVAETSPLASESRGLAVGARARVANTDGLGVVFYAAPRDSARLPAGLLEGTVITILELSGEDWARVQSDGKQAGWVRTAYLSLVD